MGARARRSIDVFGQLSKTKLKNQADLIHALRGSEGDVAVNIIRKGKQQGLNLAALARPRMIDW